MPFPQVERMIYRKNPLDQVVCQLRFPPLLRIDAEVPANFQDRIRADYPDLVEESDVTIELPSDAGRQFPPEILGQAMKSLALKNYGFKSEDGLWKVNLTRTFLALSTARYTRWEEFKEKLQVPFRALENVYRPDYFSRIGLRYVDVVKRSALGLDGVPWRDLLQPYVAGILASSDVGDSVKAFEATYDVGLAENRGSVRIVMKFVRAVRNNEICFVIDSDFFGTGKTKGADVFDTLDFFNVRASRLIRWAITPRLHEAMEPEVI